MEFFNSAVDVLQTLVIALGAGLGIWGVINLLEGYGKRQSRCKKPGHETAQWRAAALPLSVCSLFRSLPGFSDKPQV